MSQPGATVPVEPAGAGDVDATEPVGRLLRDLRTSPSGLPGREAARRLAAYGPNQLRRRGSGHVWRQLGRQFTHPLALLLWAAACTGGQARVVVVATGMGTELGRIAALSERVKPEQSPLERQIRRVAPGATRPRSRC